MLGLPVSTEVRKIIPKKKVFEHFASDMSAERRKSFDADVARITVCNEVSTVSLNLADGKDIHAFFVVQVSLRRKEFDKQNIVFIARTFGQNLVLVLTCEQVERLALWQTRLIMDEWQPDAPPSGLEHGRGLGKRGHADWAHRSRKRPYAERADRS